MDNLSNEATQKNMTLVIGGTGKTGRRIVKRLKARDVRVRVGSRSGSPPFNWNDETTWEPVLQNVKAAYIAYYPDLAVPGAASTVKSFTQRAAEHGVRRMVLLSGRGEKGAERTEEAIKETGADWTILRCSWFSQNFSESFLLEPVLAGEVALPAGNIKEPFIDVEDIADVAVAALTEDGHAGQLYELTGPRLLSFAEAIEEISKATNRDIRYTQISMKQYASLLEKHSIPQEVVELQTYLFGEVLDGRNAHLTDSVRHVLGRAPRDFRDFARETASTGVWKVE